MATTSAAAAASLRAFASRSSFAFTAFAAAFDVTSTKAFFMALWGQIWRAPAARE